MPEPIRVLSSMATKALLAELADSFEARTGQPVALTSIGGVDAARRLEAGETWDVVVLAANAIEQLAAHGAVKPESRTDLVHSGVAVAVPANHTAPDIATEAALQMAVLAAPTLGYSTGPSGVQLARLFERWGIADTIAPRIVTPPPGTPVGALVARGEVALGFQQWSEMMGVPGIRIVGPLPAAVQITTTFSAALPTTTHHPLAAALVAFMADPAHASLKTRHGMDAA